MDILRQGHHVEVLEPPELRDQVAAELRMTLKQYR
jgi:predicted DNA-binding transcriptional regulator YafY